MDMLCVQVVDTCIDGNFAITTHHRPHLRPLLCAEGFVFGAPCVPLRALGLCLICHWGTGTARAALCLRHDGAAVRAWVCAAVAALLHVKVRQSWLKGSDQTELTPLAPS